MELLPKSLKYFLLVYFDDKKSYYGSEGKTFYNKVWVKVAFSDIGSSVKIGSLPGFLCHTDGSYDFLNF